VIAGPRVGSLADLGLKVRSNPIGEASKLVCWSSLFSQVIPDALVLGHDSGQVIEAVNSVLVHSALVSPEQVQKCVVIFRVIG